MHIAVALPPILLLSATLSLADAKFYRPSQYILYKAGPNPHPYVHGKPTSRLKNHCAYVVEKTVSFTMQDGVAPYVKAQYNKCAWGQKCPTLIYHVMYKPVYKVAHKTLTELEWRCCPGYSGYGCMEGPPAYQHLIKAMPPFKGPPFKGPPIKGNPWSQSKGHPPMKPYPMLTKGPPMKGPPPMKSYPVKAKGPPPSNVKSYLKRPFGPPLTHPSYRGSSSKPYTFGPQHIHQPDRHEGPDFHQPELDQQGQDYHQPELDHQGSDYHHPELDHQGQDPHQPELDHQGSDYHHPELDHQGSDHPQPEPDHQGSDHHQPEPDHQGSDHHQLELDHQGSDHHQLELDHQRSDHHQPEPDNQGSDHHQPELDHQGPDHHQPELDHQGPNHQQSEPDHHWPDHLEPDHHQPESDQEGPYHQEPDNHEPDHHQPEPDHQGPDHHEPDHHQPEPYLEPNNHQQPEPDHPDHPDLTDHPFHSELEPVTDETALPAGSQEMDGQPRDTVDSESTERLDRMEEDMRRLSQGLETLRRTMNGLEDGLRASLWEDANRMLSALLSAAPSPVPAPALSSSPHSTVGFADIPGGDPDAEGLDVGQAFPGLSELTGRVEGLRTELQAKAAELEELRGSVIRHDGTLKKMSGGADSLTRAEARDTQKAMEDLVDAKLGGARTEILGEFEKCIESAESRCGERAREVSRQCHREQQERQDLMELALEVSATGLRKELGYLQTQIQGHDLREGCCGRVTGLGERVHLLEQLVAGLNQSQGHLGVELGGHKAHVEAMLEGRLEDVEAKLNLTECGKVRGGSTSSSGSGSGGVQGSSSEGEVRAGSLEARLEGKLKALEVRLLTALGDLENATAPALLEGHVVPTLETEVESLRRRLEVDVDRVQKQLSGLELLCTSSSQPILQGEEATSNTHRVEEDKTGGGEENGLLDMENNRLNSLNVTLQSLLTRLSQREDHQEGEEGSSVQGEIMLLKFNARSMNLTLKGLKDSVGLVVQDVGRANTSWQEREERLAQQVKGVVQLLGRQASMLGVGEKRLTRMKGELQELRRRLAGEVQGCRSTALGVQKEVVEVGGRVASVEGQCKGFSHLANDLERIRAELERQSDGYLSQVNGTLTNHAHQLSELRQELRNCTWNVEPTQQSLYLLEPEQLREDQ